MASPVGARHGGIVSSKVTLRRQATPEVHSGIVRAADASCRAARHSGDKTVSIGRETTMARKIATLVLALTALMGIGIASAASSMAASNSPDRVHF
jgi:hypothetical protein